MPNIEQPQPLVVKNPSQNKLVGKVMMAMVAIISLLLGMAVGFFYAPKTPPTNKVVPNISKPAEVEAVDRILNKAKNKWGSLMVAEDPPQLKIHIKGTLVTINQLHDKPYEGYVKLTLRNGHDQGDFLAYPVVVYGKGELTNSLTWKTVDKSEIQVGDTVLLLTSARLTNDLTADNFFANQIIKQQ